MKHSQRDRREKKGLADFVPSVRHGRPSAASVDRFEGNGVGTYTVNKRRRGTGPFAYCQFVSLFSPPLSLSLSCPECIHFSYSDCGPTVVPHSESAPRSISIQSIPPLAIPPRSILFITFRMRWKASRGSCGFPGPKGRRENTRSHISNTLLSLSSSKVSTPCRRVSMMPDHACLIRLHSFYFITFLIVKGNERNNLPFHFGSIQEKGERH